MQAQRDAVKPLEGQHLFFVTKLVGVVSWLVGFVLGAIWNACSGLGKGKEEGRERLPVPEPGPEFERFRK